MGHWDSRGGVLPDVPRSGQLDPRGDGGNTSLAPPIPPKFSNPQSTPPGWTDVRRKRLGWIKANLASVAGAGHMPDRADFEALPEAHRANARAMARQAVDLFNDGNQGPAREHAAEAAFELEAAIGKTWRPPFAEGPDPAVLDAIRRAH
jgi:hypothetical protein